MHFLCVGTPQRDGEYAADMSYVDAAIESLVPLVTRPALIVGKSTVPVGTASRLSDRIAELAPPAPVELAWSPEFTREGLAVEDTLRPNRLVFGVRSEHAEKLLREVFAPVIDSGSPVVVCDYATAELVKMGANSFLATKISYINAMAELCDATGADVTLLADALGHDERIGRQFLNAGLGYGGGCLPKDLRAFMARAGELGAEEALTFLREVDAINMRRRQKVVDVTAERARQPVDRQAGRGARRGVQAQHRRHPRLPRAQRRRPDPPARRRGERLRPEGDGQRPPVVPDAAVRRPR